MENQDEKSLQVTEKDVKPDPTWWLLPAERYAYGQFLLKYCKTGSNSYPISPGLQEGLFALFINGKTLAEIRKLNPNLSMGQLVHAAIENDWYQAKELYLATMVERAKVRAIQATAEGLEFAADLVAALRKQHGEHIARFLQTGQIEDLGAATSTTVIRQLKELTELLSKLTGQDQTKRVKFEGVVEHRSAIESVPVAPVRLLSPSNTLKTWAVRELEQIKKEEES